jgi:hypothetical protein
MKELTGGDKNIYDLERDKLETLNSRKDLTKLKTLLYEDDGALKSPA